VRGPLNQTLLSPGMAELMDFEYVPWGNAYFVTAACGGAGGYSLEARRCFDEKCGLGVAARPADCFTGPLICQNGPVECAMNRYMACAKHVYGAGAFLSYMPYIQCLDNRFGDATDAAAGGTIASQCATATGLDFGAIKLCYDGADGDAASISEASATPAHPFCPHVVVNGAVLDGPLKAGHLLGAICGALGAARPAGCPQVTIA